MRRRLCRGALVTPEAIRVSALIMRMHTRECDECGARGIVCATTSGEIQTDEHGLTCVAEGLRDLGLAVLVAGRTGGRELHNTYCEGCA